MVYDSAWDHAGQPSQTNCYQDGEASLAVRKELAAGPVIASVVGYTLAYNTLDNNKGPTQGVLVEFKQDLAGVGGDVHNVKQTIDARLYNEIFPDIVGVLRGQAGYAVGFDGGVRMLDEFQAGHVAGARLPTRRLRSARHHRDRLWLRRHPGRARRFAILGVVARVPDPDAIRAKRTSA